MTIRIRHAANADIPSLQHLLERSVRGLQAQDYSPTQIDSALQMVYGIDSQLIADGTYYVAEEYSDGAVDSAQRPKIVGCGGWGKRRTLFGGDQCLGRHDDLLDPRSEPAKIRAFFIHPNWSRRGIGSMLLDKCESDAQAAGFTTFEMGSTLTGLPFYRSHGYEEISRIEIPLGAGDSFPIVHMRKVTTR